MRSPFTLKKEMHEDDFENELDADLEAVAALHEGAALVAAVKSVLGQLPGGRVHLLSTSAEGCALAAGCVLLAPLRAVSWHLTSLTRVDPLLPDGALVVVEAVDPGVGWRRAVERRFPTAAVCLPDVPVGRVAAAG
jgi:hypothetical protein